MVRSRCAPRSMLLLAPHLTSGTPHHLIVAHSHAHADHAAWDSQFAHRPDTTVVARRQDAIQRAFAIDEWPGGVGSLDLGQRDLTVIATPGHEDQHIAIYDAQSGLVLTGDTFYPGLLVVNDGRRIAPARADSRGSWRRTM